MIINQLHTLQFGHDHKGQAITTRFFEKNKKSSNRAFAKIREYQKQIHLLRTNMTFYPSCKL